MASITNSFFPVSPTLNRTHQFTSPGRKRRPVDPPGEEACNGTCYTSPLLSPKGSESGQPPNKRTRTVDSSLEMLSLGAADPPGYLSHQTFPKDVRKNQMVDLQPSAEGKSNDTTSTSSTMTIIDKRASASANIHFLNSPTNKRMQQFRQMELSSSGITDADNSEMSLEGSDMYSDDESIDSSSGSVSESSIRNSMYQVVFGRMKGSGSGGPGARYDIVDAKIEDMIRRSRIEAVLKSCKEKLNKDPPEDHNGDSAKRMDID